MSHRSSILLAAKPLAKKAIENRLEGINAYKGQWKLIEDNEGNKLTTQFVLPTFTKTWNFLGEVAKIVHRQRHHPTFTTTYNKIDISLTTHDEGNRVTDKDTELANSIQQFYYKEYAQKESGKGLKTFIKDVSDKSNLTETSRAIEDLISNEK